MIHQGIKAVFKTLRSSLTLLEKEGTEPFKVPFKTLGDHSSTS